MGRHGQATFPYVIYPAPIALAAIQELYRQNQELKAANEELRRRVERLEGHVASQ